MQKQQKQIVNVVFRSANHLQGVRLHVHLTGAERGVRLIQQANGAAGPSKSCYVALGGRICQIIACLGVVFCSLDCEKHLGIHGI